MKTRRKSRSPSWRREIFLARCRSSTGGKDPRTPSVVEDGRFAILARPDFLSFVRANPDVALGMLAALTDRLRRTDELIRSRVSRNVNEEERKRATMADRAADMIAEFGGSWKFIGVSIALIIFWIVFNSYLLLNGFDPKPYAMLNLVLAVIAGMQAPIIMMSQNRQGEKDRLARRPGLSR